MVLTGNAEHASLHWHVCLHTHPSCTLRQSHSTSALGDNVPAACQHAQVQREEHALQDAPYLLEACAQGFAGEEDQVQLALLSAAMKLFFKRPPECQQLLGATLAAASAESSQDVHDRALLYYRYASLPADNPLFSRFSYATTCLWQAA